MLVSKLGDRLIDDLALVIALHPKASLKEIAEMAGVSKATLYRFAGSRESMISKLECHCKTVFEHAVADEELAHGEPIEAMQALISNYLTHNELLLYITLHCREDQIVSTSDTGSWKHYWSKLDAFFLRCQLLGIIRVDIPAPLCCEMFINIILAVTQAVRTGRTAAQESAALVEKFLMHGASASSACLHTGSAAPLRTDVHRE